MEINRKIPTVEVSLDELIINKSVELDENFLKKYRNFLTGKLSGYFTRIQRELVKAGYYTMVDGSWSEYIEPVENWLVEDYKVKIKSGHRPFLVVIKNINKSCDKRYVCPDHVVALYAYESLGITMIPVIILDRNPVLSESAYLTSHHVVDGKDIGCVMYGYKPYNFTEVYSCFGSKNNSRDVLVLDTIASKCDDVLQLVKNFHYKDKNVIHYNHTTYSTVYRLKENVLAIKHLLSEGYFYQAMGLVRSVYELSIDYYLDWLAPEFMGPWLQFKSRFNKNEINKMLSKIASEKVKPKSRDIYIKKKEYIFSFLSNVSVKAEVFPLGAKFYDDFYRYFSSIIHQDFHMTERHASLLDGIEPNSSNDISIEQMVVFLDVISSSVLVRVNQDYGGSEF
ncbi:TPA: DUF5677 domain-containing protein [Vibrio parahaemolyticus]